MNYKGCIEPCRIDQCPFWDADQCNKPITKTDDICWLYDNRPIYEILPELVI
jgi:hypothetical protein